MKNSANNSIWDIRLFSIYKTVSVENLTSQHSHNISATAAAEDEHHRRHHNESIPTYIHKSQTYIININHIDIVIFFSVVHTWTVSSLLLRFKREKNKLYFIFFFTHFCPIPIRNVCNVLTFYFDFILIDSVLIKIHFIVIYFATSRKDADITKMIDFKVTHNHKIQVSLCFFFYSYHIMNERKKNDIWLLCNSHLRNLWYFVGNFTKSFESIGWKVSTAHLYSA